MNCTLCPVGCGTDRGKNVGYCGAGAIKIAAYRLHPYEEPCISFSAGSGCIFFCGCPLKCVFCQNYEVSRSLRGREISARELADIFRILEEMGADNINLVNPTHYADKIAQAFSYYRPALPVVYNTHGYEREETLRLADTFTDIYLTDLKFIDPALSARYTARRDYADYALPAVRRMAQKPPRFSAEGKMLSGCIVRHLVLPLAVYDTVNVVKFVAGLPESVYFSLMSQYTPYGEIGGYGELQRKITAREYEKAVAAVREYGLKNVFLQDRESVGEGFIPAWDF